MFFTDEDGCPIIEPLNSDGLEVYFRKLKLRQQAKGIDGFICSVIDDQKKRYSIVLRDVLEVVSAGDEYAKQLRQQTGDL